jgi:hypothetical protein
MYDKETEIAPKKCKSCGQTVEEKPELGACSCGGGMPKEETSVCASDDNWTKVAQNNSATQTEPVDGVQDEKKSKENKTNVPRNESKSKPEGNWTRPKGVDKPVKVREEKHEMGQGGKDLHTDVVPRDGSGDGIGGESVNFAEEKGADATSGNENSYVQDWEASAKGTPAGNEDNHATSGPNTASGKTDLLVLAKTKVAEAKGLKVENLDAVDLGEVIFVLPYGDSEAGFEVSKEILV